MRIGIVGTGAIGGWLGVRLARAGHRISVLARGESLAVLRSRPWQLVSDDGAQFAQVRAEADARALGVQDMIVLAVKGPALATLAPLLAPMIGPDTAIVPAMNGVPWWFLLGGGGELPGTTLAAVDPDGTIAAALPFGQVVGCVVHASVATDAPGIAVHRAGNRLILGEPGGGTARLDDVAAAFRAAGFDVRPSGAIQQDVWYKLWGNMTMNPISAMTGATADRILDDPLVAAFILGIMAEAQAIGSRIGCAIDERGEDRNAVTRKLGAFKTSMLQDAEAGRVLEIDQLLGAPIEIANRLGIPVPGMNALFGLTRLFARSHRLYPG